MKEAQTFVMDGGNFEVRGFKVAEVRNNGWALTAVACDYAGGGCHALHIHLMVENADGDLNLVTTFDSVDADAIQRSGTLFRTLIMLVHGVLDAELCLPKDDEEDGEPEKGKGFTKVIPGFTPWSKA